MTGIPIGPDRWGPSTWASIHSVASRCDDRASKKAFHSFMEKIINKLPCETCQKHARKYYREHPLTYNEVDPVYGDISVLLWSWRFHNNVNRRLDKREFSKEELIDRYLPELRQGECPSCKIEIIPTARIYNIIRTAENFPRA